MSHHKYSMSATGPEDQPSFYYRIVYMCSQDAMAFALFAPSSTRIYSSLIIKDSEHINRRLCDGLRHSHIL